jgi:Domain of unknown function (DUF4406)
MSWEKQWQALATTIRGEAIERTLDVLREQYVLRDIEPPEIDSRVGYLSGPITHSQNPHREFAVAAANLRRRGAVVVSPMELTQHDDYLANMARDFVVCCSVDCGYMIPGWELSHGSAAEARLLNFLGRPLLDARTAASILSADSRLPAAV